MTIALLRYIAGFFMLTTLAMTGFAIYRGEVINTLQSQLISKQDKQIKVVIDTAELADKLSQKTEATINNIETKKEVTIREVERIIKDPVYVNVCFDAAGMSALHQAIHAPITSEYDTALQAGNKSD